MLNANLHMDADDERSNICVRTDVHADKEYGHVLNLKTGRGEVTLFLGPGEMDKLITVLVAHRDAEARTEKEVAHV